MSDERRVSPRHHAYIGAEIDGGNGPVRAAITRDGSATGILLLTRAPLTVGQRVELKVFFVEGESHIVTGKVVRQEPLDHDENTLWRTKVGVAMDAPDPLLAEHFEKLSEKQSKIYGEK
jgi:PilZ domain